jgi:hypothetical protein
MNRDLWQPVVEIGAGIIGIAILAVLVSKNAQTPQVLSAAGSAFSNAISAATAPITGQAAAPVNTASGAGNIFGNLGLQPLSGLSLQLNP